MQKNYTKLNLFLNKIDIYTNKPRMPAAIFFDTLTNFSGNDEVTQFDGTYFILVSTNWEEKWQITK